MSVALLQSSHPRSGLIFQLRVLNTFLMMVQLTIAYILMLVAMTYNGGLFSAVIIGL
jgi:hypothetical protein